MQQADNKLKRFILLKRFSVPFTGILPFTELFLAIMQDVG